MNYYEIEFSNNHDENTATWICIKGKRQPSVSEAQSFCSVDSKKYGMPVTGVFALPNKQYAMDCYDFSNEENWPVFDHEATTCDLKRS